jgi:protein-tyrosine phosphatase
MDYIYNIADYCQYYTKNLKYRVSLFAKLIQHNINPEQTPWWTEVIDNVIVGAIPLKNYDHINLLVNGQNVRHVLTLLDEFEINTETYLTVPVKEEDWKENNVNQKIIHAADFNPLTMEQIHEGVSFIEKIREENKTDKIYVHCKAGHGRSVIIVICYLIKTRNMDFEKAYHFIKDKRHSINMNQDQFQSIINYFMLHSVDANGAHLKKD